VHIAEQRLSFSANRPENLDADHGKCDDVVDDAWDPRWQQRTQAAPYRTRGQLAGGGIVRGMQMPWPLRIRIKRELEEKTTRTRLGSYEFKKKGVPRFDLRDPYHLAAALTWPQFLAAFITLYLLVNVVFATLFWLEPGSVAHARPNSFVDVFFFSIETLATVGYGDMHPATLYGHAIAATEIVCGLAFTAILTGLTFVRFSRPKAKFVFAQHPVVAIHNGKPTLMLRIGYGRAGVGMDAAARLNILLSVTTPEGARVRRAQELRLERAHLPVFPLSWTLEHVLDERSPLHGFDAARAIAAEAHLFLMLEARDPTLATVVHDFRNYAAEDIRFGMRYADVISLEADGTPVADFTRIGELEPDVGEHWEAGWTEREEMNN
jgi:inward rectifier potassium channel